MMTMHSGWLDRVYKMIIFIYAKKSKVKFPAIPAEFACAFQAQKRCLPICTISGRDHIHWLVAVAGLK